MITADLNTGIEIIERKECLELLASEEVGRLGVVLAGQPEIFPINYAMDEDGVVFPTDAGIKLTGSIRGQSCSKLTTSTSRPDRLGAWSSTAEPIMSTATTGPHSNGGSVA